MDVHALIVAGGSGRRMAETYNRPKQFCMLSGQPVLAHTINQFNTLSAIDDIILVVPATDINYVNSHIVDEYSFSKVSRVLAGGSERQDSVAKGLDSLSDNDDLIIIHDGVRPFVPQKLIIECIEAAKLSGAAVSGISVTDTVKKVRCDGTIHSTVDRDNLWLTQTPQTFRASLIKTAYKTAFKDGYYGTDDSAVVERMGHPVIMIPGSRDNIKITTSDDLNLCEYLAEKINESRIRL